MPRACEAYSQESDSPLPGNLDFLMIRSILSHRHLRVLFSSLAAAMLLAPPTHAQDAAQKTTQKSESAHEATEEPQRPDEKPAADPMRINKSSWGAPRPTYEGPLAYTLFDMPGRVMARGTIKPRYSDNFGLDDQGS
jgi:hypothetical protein